MELMLQIIAIISERETNDLKDLLSFELDDDIENEYSVFYSKKSFYYDRFEFINNLYNDFKNFSYTNVSHKKEVFIKEKWKDYQTEYSDFMQYEDTKAQEYLIKRDLLRLLNNSKNIKNIIDGVKKYDDK